MAAMLGGMNSINSINFDPGKVLLGKAGSKPYLQTSTPQTGNPQSAQANIFQPSTPITSPPNTGLSGPQAIGPVNPAQSLIPASGAPAQLTVPDSGVLGPESIRASGTGPFDPAYRQNLSTFAGGQFTRPGGSLAFNPTGKLEDLPGMPTGAGTAPVPGMPQSLMQMALGGQPFSFSNPPQPQPPANTPDQFMQSGADWRDWLNQLRTNGSGFALNLQ